MSTIAQPPYTLLVANISRPYPSLITGADPAIQSYHRTRTGFEFQMIQNLGFAKDQIHGPSGTARSLVTSSLLGIMDPSGGTPPPTGDVEVVDNTFSGLSATLQVGPYSLVSNRDFIPGGGVIATATALATAISALPGYTATPAGAVITVEGPEGQVGLKFDAQYAGGAANFSFTYVADERVLGQPIGGGPIFPPNVLPAGVPNGPALVP
jgi:hypothetical protein